MQIALLKSFTTPSGKGWLSSVTFHLAAIGSLAFYSTATTKHQIIKFTSADSGAITLVARQLQSESQTSTTEVRVEVQPLEARIENRRFVHRSVTDDHPTELPASEAISQTSTGRPARTSRELDVPQLKSTKNDSPRRTEHTAQPQVSSRVESLSAVETTLPKFGNNRPPIYPRAAISQRWEGTVLLRLHLSADGSVTDVEILRSSGFDVLDGAAVSAVKTWSASPATRGGKPIDTTIRLPVKFRLPTSSNIARERIR